ncbi:hypothetical protein D1871_07160 [Nakamurella silvestris]|nr:hypothetical protein D1871_07160 [Nakamurella silvestris]
MSRTTDWSPLWNGDPVPGDPDRVQAYANENSSIATAIGEAYDNLNRITDQMQTTSQAIQAFRDKAVKVQVEIVLARTRYSDAGRSLAGYAARLRDAQSSSLDLLHQAKAADQDVRDAKWRAQHHSESVKCATDPVQQKTAMAEFNRAKGAMQAADGRIQALRSKLQAVIAERDRAAETTKQELLHSEKISAIKSEGFWDRAGAGIRNFAKLVRDHFDLVLLALAALTAVLALVFPPVGGALVFSLVRFAISALGTARDVLDVVGSVRDLARGEGSVGAVLGAVATLGIGLALGGLKGVRQTKILSAARGRQLMSVGGMSARQGLARGVGKAEYLARRAGAVKGPFFKELKEYTFLATNKTTGSPAMKMVNRTLRVGTFANEMGFESASYLAGRVLGPKQESRMTVRPWNPYICFAGGLPRTDRRTSR